MSIGSGIPLVDSLLVFVGAWYAVRAAGMLLGNVLTFVRYRRQDAADKRAELWH